MNMKNIIKCLTIFIWGVGNILNGQVPNFCAEPVPQNDTVMLKLSRQIKYDIPRIGFLKRQSIQFFPIVEKIIASYGLPADLKYIPLVESAFISNAESPTKARGFWQFMPQTAIEMGLSLSPIDEREDIIKSTHAACKYFKSLLNTFNSFTLSATAYNLGPQKLIDQMAQQKKVNYFMLKLNPETSGYIYKILSVKELFINTDKYKSFLDSSVLELMTQTLKYKLSEKPNRVESNIRLINHTNFPVEEQKNVVSTDSIKVMCFFNRSYNLMNIPMKLVLRQFW